MTDGKMIKVMARIYRLTNTVDDLINNLRAHPNGEALRDALHDNGLGCVWDCASIAADHLNYPERWVYVNAGTLTYVGPMAQGEKT